MSKTALPIYDLCSLRTDGLGQQEVMVNRFSTYLKVHPQLQHPHRHSFYHFVLFTKGVGTYSIDFVKFPVLPNQMYFMVPGQVHAWDLVGDTDGYIINFSKSFFYSFLLRPEYLEQFPFLGGGIEESIISLPDNVMQKVVSALETILEEGQFHEAYRLDMIRVMLLQVFLSVHKALSKKPGNNIVSAKFIIIRNFQNLVEQHFNTIRLPKDYAALLYITPNHLNALCKEILGKPAGEVIRERVLLEAKRLLIEAKFSITEIAAQLSFQDNSYFTKFFKKYTAVTPEDFRRTNI